MNKIILGSAVLVWALVVAPAALAQSEELEAPGITPGSPFYFLDRLGEGLGLFFAFSPEAKAARQASYAEERLAEARVLVNEGEDELVEETVDEYGQLISEAAANLAAAAQSGEDVEAALIELVTRATSIHQTVLAEVYTKVPEQAKPAIERAMTQSAQGQQAALNALSGEQQEAVIEQAEEQRQQLEERLDTLRQQGVPIPPIPLGAEEGDTTPEAGSPRGSNVLPGRDPGNAGEPQAQNPAATRGMRN